MKAQRYTLWVALVVLAIGATMLHLRIHPPDKGHTYFWGNLFAWLDLVLVSLLFLSRKTAIWGLLLNSFLAYIGMILMSDFAITATLLGKIQVGARAHFFSWLLQTTFPDVAILFADFLVGQALYRVIIAGPKGA